METPEVFRGTARKRAPGWGAMEVALDTVCFVIGKARELVIDEDRGVDEDEGEEGSAFASSPEVDELREFIDSLTEAEQAEMVAIAWIGHGTFTAEDWDEAVESALEEHPKAAADYLLTLPLLAEDLASGLGDLGLECEDE